MKRGIDNGLLLTDMDGAFFRIRNLGVTHDIDLVETDDPEMSDARIILPGTITDDSVADDAGIDQSKLDLPGPIPILWFGTDDIHAAQGDLVQPNSAKDQVNGYAGLGLDGKLGTGKVPTSGTGTLHQIDINFPVGEITIMPGSSTTLRTFDTFWMAQDANTWLGNISGATGVPRFTPVELPLALIPDFDANKIGSETFDPERLPTAVGVGVDHAPGMLPDPGPAITNTQGSDYFARDMTFKPMVTMVINQPTLPSPSISIQSYYRIKAYVNITAPFDGVALFYSVDGDPFVEVTATTLPLICAVGASVSAYGARDGYNNSDIVMYTVPPNPGPTPTG